MNAKKKKQPAPTEVTMTVDPRRLAEPNFGYKDVRVSKILVHPIKVCLAIECSNATGLTQTLELSRNVCGSGNVHT